MFPPLKRRSPSRSISRCCVPEKWMGVVIGGKGAWKVKRIRGGRRPPPPPSPLRLIRRNCRAMATRSRHASRRLPIQVVGGTKWEEEWGRGENAGRKTLLSNSFGNEVNRETTLPLCLYPRMIIKKKRRRNRDTSCRAWNHASEGRILAILTRPSPFSSPFKFFTKREVNPPRVITSLWWIAYYS